MITQARTLSFDAVSEPAPGEQTRALLRARWPAYRRWMARAEPLDADQCIRALRHAMPELVPTLQRLLELAGGGEDHARFLSLYQPPRLTRGCSQAVIHTPDGPALLRTYDHAPHLFDGVILQSRWGSRPTLAVTDCLWGALDGINADGLAVALAFGGRNAVGPGFAAPLLVRYLLETCATTPEATAALARLPVHMPYTFVVLDADGKHVTAFLSPDRPAQFRDDRVSTNHQRESDWPEYSRFAASVERHRCIADALEQDPGFDRLLGQFLTDPIWRTSYAQGWGTLYAAEYRPHARTLGLHWPSESRQFGLDAFDAGRFSVRLA